MPGSAGSKYGLIAEGVPVKEDARARLLNKLEPLVPTYKPGEMVKLKLTDKAKFKLPHLKRDNGRPVAVRGVGETSKEILVHTSTNNEEWLTFDDVEPLG